MEIENLFKCLICGKGYKEKKNYNRHFIDKYDDHFEKFKKKEFKFNEGSKEYTMFKEKLREYARKNSLVKCPVHNCPGENNHQNRNFPRHLFTHTEHKPKCPKCSEEFRDIDEFKKHFKKSESCKLNEEGLEKFQFECEYEGCDKTYVKQGDLLNHEKKKHPNFKQDYYIQFRLMEIAVEGTEKKWKQIYEYILKKEHLIQEKKNDNDSVNFIIIIIEFFIN